MHYNVAFAFWLGSHDRSYREVAEQISCGAELTALDVRFPNRSTIGAIASKMDVPAPGPVDRERLVIVENNISW